MISRPFSTNGRVSGFQFFVAFVALNGLGRAANSVIEKQGLSTLLYIIPLLLAWPIVTLMVQRAHDSGRDGRFVAVALGLMGGGFILVNANHGFAGDVTEGVILSTLIKLLSWAAVIIGSVMVLIVYFAHGAKDSNAFGPSPRRAAAEAHEGQDKSEDALINLAERRGYHTGE